MNHNTQVRGLQAINHILMLIGISYVLINDQYSYLIASLLTYWCIGVLGINIGMHRLLAHRSFNTWLWLEKTLALISVLTAVGSPLAWVALHRQHHRYTETPMDPHSPYILGSAKAWFGIWNKTSIDARIIKDLRKDRFHKFLHRHYIAITVTYVCMLALIDPWLVVFMYAIPACLCLHSSSAIIVIAHKHGYKTYKTNDQSRNSWIASLITLGEGWHNNHHAHPRDWNNQHKWWELDITAWMIRLIKK